MELNQWLQANKTAHTYLQYIIFALSITSYTFRVQILSEHGHDNWALRNKTDVSDVGPTL